MFNDFVNDLNETRYQMGCSDRDRGLLPQRQDSPYLNGYLADRPKGLDDEMQYYPTLESYLNAKHRYSH